ncbi:DUF502 domain-containing protein [Halobaculum sp. D14]|uniref:DUF502 domain-containing protein n=1 Tax=Halobaculum sp. D14 TaxID=3421642 RepID=UPI003EBEAF45
MRQLIRGAFITGLAVIVPLLITVIVLAIAVQYVYRYLDAFSTLVLDFSAATRFTIPGVGVVGKEQLIELIAPVVLLYLIFVVGLFVNSTRFGSIAIDYFDSAIATVPGVGSVYESFRQMSDVMLEEDAQNFREVKLVEFPHEGAYTLGFLTTETPDALREPTGHAEMQTLFLPLAPNPVMGGHLVHMPAEKVMDVDMTVEEGIRAVVTSGVAVSGGTGGAGGVSEETLRELASVEHADQQFDPSADSPSVRRADDVDVERDDEWDRQVAPERSKTPTDIARRTRAQRDTFEDQSSALDDEQPYSLYGQRESTVTPATEAGRYEPETADTDERPAEKADRPKAERTTEKERPAEKADRDPSLREDTDTRPEEAGDRPGAKREHTDGRPAEVHDQSELTADPDESGTDPAADTAADAADRGGADGDDSEEGDR